MPDTPQLRISAAFACHPHELCSVCGCTLVLMMGSVTSVYALQGLIADGCSHLRGINTLIKEANSRQH